MKTHQESKCRIHCEACERDVKVPNGDLKCKICGKDLKLNICNGCHSNNHGGLN